MEFNQLKYFLAVTELGSFSKAASQCSISQPALSIQIQKLENEIGSRLLDRARRRVVPTDAGRILVGHARRVLAQIETARLEIRSTNEKGAGKLAFGILPTIAPYLLSHILTTFQERCPKARFTVHEDTSFQLMQLLEENKLDFVIVCLPIREHGFEKEELFSEELLLALPVQHPLAQRDHILAEDLRRENFILLHESHCLSDQILHYFNRHGFSPRIALQSGQLATIESLIRAGIGISLVPQMAVNRNTMGIAYRSLEKPQPRRVVAVVRREKRPLKRAAQEFLKHLRVIGKQFGERAREAAPDPSVAT